MWERCINTILNVVLLTFNIFNYYWFSIYFKFNFTEYGNFHLKYLITLRHIMCVSTLTSFFFKSEI